MQDINEESKGVTKVPAMKGSLYLAFLLIFHPKFSCSICSYALFYFSSFKRKSQTLIWHL
jgi:hypothetical protein